MKLPYKKIADFCYVSLICGLLFLPFAAMPLKKDSDDSSENRTLAAFPKGKTEENTLNTNYFMELEAWFSDHFAFRPQMVTAYGTLLHYGLGDSSNSDVIRGKGDWLYYADTASDASEIATISPNGAKHIANSFALISDYAAKQGTEFLFVPAPNKASIYPQYLPNRYIRTGGKNNYDLISEALGANPDYFCDLRSVLRNASDAQPNLLYHKLDTHWNGRGAMLGFSAMMQSFGRSDKDFPFAPSKTTKDWEGDLWNMLFPSIENFDENVVYEIPKTYEYVGRFRSIDDLTIKTTSREGEGTLLMFRDSFGRAVIPLLSEAFSECTYIRADRPSLDMLEAQSYSHLICEIVERNLPQYLQYAPILPAQETDTISPDTPLTQVLDSGKQQVVPTVFGKKEGSYLHLFGTYHSVLSDADAVYCQVGNRIYHAFPCYEAELMGEEVVRDNGFSLYLPINDVADTDSVRIIVQRDSEVYHLGTNTITNIEE